MGHSLPADILRKALDTYDMEVAYSGELHREALARAIAAGLHEHEVRTVERVAHAAETFARELDAEDSDVSPVPLYWFAAKIRTEVPPHPAQGYEPQPGDLVEVTLTGPVAVFGDACEKCGHETEKASWSVTDDYSNLEYFFDQRETHGMLRVRKLAAGDSS